VGTSFLPSALVALAYPASAYPAEPGSHLLVVLPCPVSNLVVVAAVEVVAFASVAVVVAARPSSAEQPVALADQVGQASAVALGSLPLQQA
jgi:hypothetical protein